QELQAHAQRHLPRYMVPSAIALMDAFPRTRNGKLDRARLPAPAEVSTPGPSRAGPRTSTEQVLAAIWREVLGLEEVGLEDHFFALGGDSLRVIQVVLRARARGLSLAVQECFQDPSLSELAKLSDQAAGAEANAKAIALSPAQRRLLGRG